MIQWLVSSLRRFHVEERGDLGYAGSFPQQLHVHGGELDELRDIAGPPPVIGKEWILVNLRTGQVKWYPTRARKSYRRKK